MIKKVLFGIAVLAALILAIPAFLPATFRVERAIDIQAAPERVFAQVNGLHNWRAWSPWENLDPDLRRVFSGEVDGKGAVYEWRGNDKVGQGRMEIVDSQPPSKVLIKLDFIKPFEAHNMAEFTFVPTPGGTRATWAMYGPSPYLARLVGVFASMDRMVGKDFETGLANLKAVAEKPDPVPLPVPPEELE